MPTERPNATTPVSIDDVAASMFAQWTKLVGSAPGQATLETLVGHSAFEDGWWENCHGYNLANEKSVDGDGYDFTFYMCGEELALERAQALKNESPTLIEIVKVYTGEDGSLMASILAKPKHPVCRFRWFQTLDAGVADYLATLRKRFPRAWAVLTSGGTLAAFVGALKADSFFTLAEDVYLARLEPVVADVHARLAKGTGIMTPPAPTDIGTPDTGLVVPDGWKKIPASEATEDQIRTWVCHFLLMLAGLSADPAIVDAYNAIIAPDAIEGRHSTLQKAMDTMWSCALTVDGILRLLLGDAPAETKAKLLFLWHSYVNAAAMTDETKAAMVLGALHMKNELDLASGKQPHRGDPQIIDASGVAHTYTATSERDPVTGRFTTVEGGQVDKKGYKAIEAGQRVLRADGAITSVDGKTVHSFYCWIDIVTELRAANAQIGIADPTLVGGDTTRTNAGDDVGQAAVVEDAAAATETVSS